MYDIAPGDLARVDQRIAAVGDFLDEVILAHKMDVAASSDSAAMLSISTGIEARLTFDHHLVVDMLVVAINRLSRVESPELPAL